MTVKQAISRSNVKLRLVVILFALLITGLVVVAAEGRGERSSADAQGEVNRSQELRVYPV